METEWGGKVLYNHRSSHSKGVMILLNPKLDCKIDEGVRDKNRRFLTAKIISLVDYQIVLANVYAPNDINQQVLFFKELQKLLGKFAHGMMIIGGDFNCALSPSDKGGNPTSKKLLVISEIDNLCHLYSLCDVWRSLNPNARQFTWRNKSFKVQCHLDYFLVSKQLSSTTVNCDIQFAPDSDHSAIQLHLWSEDLKQQKGPGGNLTPLFLKISNTFLTYMKT